MSYMAKRFIMRIYNLPIVHVEHDEMVGLLYNIPNLKQHWVARDKHGICTGYCWCEFHNQEELDVAYNMFNNYDYHGNKLYVVL